MENIVDKDEHKSGKIIKKNHQPPKNLPRMNEQQLAKRNLIGSDFGPPPSWYFKTSCKNKLLLISINFTPKTQLTVAETMAYLPVLTMFSRQFYKWMYSKDHHLGGGPTKGNSHVDLNSFPIPERT